MQHDLLKKDHCLKQTYPAVEYLLFVDEGEKGRKKTMLEVCVAVKPFCYTSQLK